MRARLGVTSGNRAERRRVIGAWRLMLLGLGLELAWEVIGARRLMLLGPDPLHTTPLEEKDAKAAFYACDLLNLYGRNAWQNRRWMSLSRGLGTLHPSLQGESGTGDA